MIARYFIARPIFAGVISAFIVIGGLAGLRLLPISQYPNINPPEISVSTYYPGANAETVASAVAAPLEQQISGVPDMLYLSSVSSGNGQLILTARFEIGTDPDIALIHVNNRVQAALPRLPEEVRRQAVSVSKSSSTTLLIVMLTSPQNRYDRNFMNNYAVLNIVDELKRLPGVGAVNITSSRQYSMRLWLQPDKLARFGLTPSDVLAAVREQNSQFSAGRIGAEPMNEAVDFTFTVNVPGRLSEPQEFENIILRTEPSGAFVRLRDVARVELGAGRYDYTAKLDGEWGIPVTVMLQSGANALETAAAVKRRVTELAVAFPAGLAYSIPYDVTLYVDTAIRELLKTLAEAMLLVFAVVFLFLRNWRATLVPMLAVPVSLIGTGGIMYLIHFSINTLTLFGMVFAIGIVVDDAIVVLENVERIMVTTGKNARDATEQAMREVTRPVIAIVLVLLAVFMPVAFVGGITGELYRQFAVTIAGSVAISGFVALTLTPALCALLLRPEDAGPHTRSRSLSRFERWFANATSLYERGVRLALQRAGVAVGIFIGMAMITIVFAIRIPTTLVPKEDRAMVYAVPVLPDAASLSRSQAVVDTLTARVREIPGVQHVIGFAGIEGITGAYQPGGGSLWVVLKPWDERRDEASSPAAIVRTIESQSKKIGGAKILAFEPAAIQGGSRTASFEAFVQARGSSDPQALAVAVKKLLAATQNVPELKNVSTTYSANVPQIRIEVDREKAKSLGVSIDELFTTLYSTFGSYYVNDFARAGRAFEVQMQADAAFRARPEDIRNVFVRSQRGTLVPITVLTTISEVTGPELVERYNVFPGARVYGSVASGHSSGAALAAMERVAAEALPAGYVLVWSGSAYEERINGRGTTYGMFLLSILMVLLILAAQYENLSLPFAVVLAVPFAAFGAFVAIWLRGLNNDIFFQIGLVTLVGLAAKNAVLIVEFAAQKHARGKSLVESAIEAARQRFRPIVMTSAAFVLGVLPLAFSSGAGANSRHSISTGVIGGMLAATLLATLFIPLFYVWIAGFAENKHTREATTQDSESQAHS